MPTKSISVVYAEQDDRMHRYDAKWMSKVKT